MSSSDQPSGSTSSPSSSSCGKQTEPSPGAGAAGSASKPKRPKKTDDTSTTTIEIEAFLACSVCLTFPASPIHACANAHIICAQCAPKLAACPTCQLPSLSPSPVCDKLAKQANKRIPCPNFEAGCKGGVLSTKFSDHLATCYFREIICDYESGSGCGLKLQFQQYISHLKEAHAEVIHVGPKYSEFYAYATKNLGWAKFQSIMKFGEQQFICHLQISRTSQLIYSWVSVLGDRDLAEEYICQIGLRKPNSSGIGCIWGLPVLPYHEISDAGCEAKLSRNCAVLAIPVQVIKNWEELDEDEEEIFFNVTYEIRAA